MLRETFMTARIQRLYDAAIKDEKFLADIFDADGDMKPDLNSGTMQKVMFAYIYYGYLVAIYGVRWEEHT